MERFVFKTFMDKDVMQKIVIFADAFNLNIDGWRPTNGIEHPYRINLYCGGMLVGYIDAEIREIGSTKSVKTDMPFALFTPFGKVTGYFSTHFEVFDYSFERRNEFSELIEGQFKVKKCNEQQNDLYSIASSLTLNGVENNCIKIIFNRLGGNYIVDINKEDEKIEEAVRMYCGGGYLSIEHYNYPEFNKKQTLARITIELEDGNYSLPARFEFLDGYSYQKGIEMRQEFERYIPFWKKLEFIDFDDIGEEIAKHDPEMGVFIDEIRNALTLLANGTTPVSIYDKIAQLCFFYEKDRFMFDFTRAQNTEVALTRNLILKKMDNYK